MDHATAPASERRRHDPAATREALMHAAIPLFAERGFDGATVEEIARGAGVNKALVSYHFGGKQGLLTAILEAGLARAEERLAPVRASDRPAEQRLRDFVAIWVDTVSEAPAFPAMMLREMISGGRHLEPVVLDRLVGVMFGAVRGILEDGVREGRFRPVDPLLTHLSLMGSLLFFLSTGPARGHLMGAGRLPGPVPTQDDFVRHMQDLITVALAAPKPAAGVTA
jgi:TetR/AcrR family transcriptional regulator